MFFLTLCEITINKDVHQFTGDFFGLPDNACKNIMHLLTSEKVHYI